MNPPDPLALATAARVSLVTLEEEIQRIAPRAKKAKRILAKLWERIGEMQTALEAAASIATRAVAIAVDPKEAPPTLVVTGSESEAREISETRLAPSTVDRLPGLWGEVAPVSRVGWPQNLRTWQRFQQAVEAGHLTSGHAYKPAEIRTVLADERSLSEISLEIEINDTTHFIQREDGRYYVTPRR